MRADVTSFANAFGGDIIIGIEEDRDEQNKKLGTPKKICGLGEKTADDEKLRINEILRSRIDPLIPGLQVEAVTDIPDGKVIVIRIPKSYIGPHMLLENGNSRQNPYFYTRSSSGNQRMDVNELRTAFTQSDDITDRIRRFREQRISMILSGDTPISLADEPKLILHIVPVSTFQLPVPIDIVQEERNIRNDLGLIDGTSSYSRFNLDGLLTYGHNPCYLQFFKNGTIEAVDTNNLNPYEINPGVVSAIPSLKIEHEIAKMFSNYRNMMIRLYSTSICCHA